MSTRRPVAPDGVGGLSQITSPDTIDVSILPSSPYYGDGSDGSRVFDGTTTILGLVPSGNQYVMTRDLYFTNCTINAGVFIKTSGYRIFGTGTGTFNGTIHNNGTSGTGGAAVGGSPAPTGTIGSNVSTVGTGTTTVGNASIGQSQALGGAGGAGGAGSSGAGGAAGAMSAPAASLGLPRSAPAVVLAGPQASITLFRAGGSGGGGGGDGTVVGSGGGGGGGIVGVYFRVIAGTGAIQSRGGNSSATTAGNTGTGGGGGGGAVLLMSSSVIGGAVAGQTIDANAGTAGAAHGTGIAGANGTAGAVYLVPGP